MCSYSYIYISGSSRCKISAFWLVFWVNFGRNFTHKRKIQVYIYIYIYLPTCNLTVDLFFGWLTFAFTHFMGPQTFQNMGPHLGSRYVYMWLPGTLRRPGCFDWSEFGPCFGGVKSRLKIEDMHRFQVIFFICINQFKSTTPQKSNIDTKNWSFSKGDIYLFHPAHHFGSLQLSLKPSRFDVAPRYDAESPWLSGVTTKSTVEPWRD